MENRFSVVLLNSTVNWIKTMRDELGTEAGMKCFDVIRETYGEDLAGSVLFSLMGNNSPETLYCQKDYSDRTRAHSSHYDKIGIIKCLRGICQLGLLEAKHLVEDIIDHDRTVEIVVDQKHLASKEAYENVELYVKMLKNYGIVCK